MAEQDKYEPGEPFFPNHATKEVTAAYLVFGILLILLALLPPHMHPKADPITTPAHIKPEWYFLAPYQFLKLFPPQMPVLSSIPGVKVILGEGRAFSIILQGIVMAILVFIPFIDRNPARHPRKRPFAVAMGLIGLAVLLFLTFWGKYS
jgi:ubiquinol-cytochrome c reductase cytochrome b subunit